MKYWFGYLVAAIIACLTWVLMQFGERFSTLVDMVYPYVIRTLQGILAQWSGSVDFLLWQLLAVVLAVVLLASLVAVLAAKKNVLAWGGWALSAENRAWRQRTGRLAQYLSKEAKQVSRIFCGLEQRLK